MVNIEFYEDLSDAKKIISVDSEQSIAKALHLSNYDHFKIIVNGRFQDKDYIIKENDNIMLRRIPFAISATALSVIAIGVAVASAGVAVFSGIQAYKAKKEAQKIAEEADKVKNTTKDDVINRPTLRGASNTVATGKTQPYFIGENLFTPYILNAGKRYKGFSTISGTDGEDEFYNVVMECGFNSQVFRKVFIDDITLKSFANTSTPQEGVYSFDSGSVFASSDSFMEIAQDGEDFETSIFNQKVIENSINEQLKRHDSEDPSTLEDKFYTLEKNAMSCDVCISIQGLKKWDDEGTELSTSRTVNVYYSPNYAHLVSIGDSDPLGHATWNLFTFSDNGTPTNTILRKTNKTMRFIAHKEFSYNECTQYNEPITIRVSTTDLKPEQTELGEVYINWIHSNCFDVVKTREHIQSGYSNFIPERIIGEKEAGLSTLAGFRIKATESNEDKLKSIQIITSGVAKTWNSTSNSWSDTKTPTSNPASWMLEVLTSDAHAPSKMDEDEIDLPSFGEWFAFCSTKGLSVNYVISQGMTKSSLFDIILECGRATLYRNIYGKIAVAIDNAKQNANGVLNEQNLISFNYEKKLNRKSDGLKVTFIDASNDYQESSFIIMYDGSDPDNRSANSVITAVTLTGVTNHTQAVRHAYYLMKSERLRPKKCTAVVGKEGLYFTPFSKFLIQHPTLKVGKGNGEIKSVILNQTEDRIIGLELYDSVDLSENQTYTMIIQAVGSYNNVDYCTPLQLEIRGGEGITKEVEFVQSVAVTSQVIPHAHDNFSYGLGNENVVTPMLISGIENTTEGYKLTLVDYNETIINDSEVVPDYEPYFSIPQKPSASLPDVKNPTIEDLQNAKKDLANYTDLKIEQATFDVSPMYEAMFNTSIIRKGNDGSYSPNTITGKGLAIKGDTSSTPYAGNWHIFINGEENAYCTFNETTEFSLPISELLQSYNNIDSIKIQFKSKNNQLVIDEEYIPVLSGSASYSVVLQNPFQTYEANASKELTETEIKTRARVFYGLKELSYHADDGWEYGEIPLTDGFNISIDSTGEITIKALAGSSMADSGRIEIPIFIHSQTNTEIAVGYVREISRATEDITIGYNGVSIGYLKPDENGYYYTYFCYQKLSKTAIKLAQLDTTVNGYWTELTNDLVITIPEKNTLERLMESITAEYEAYEVYQFHKNYGAYSDAYQELHSAVSAVLITVGNYDFVTAQNKNAFNKKFDDYYTAKSDLNGEIASASTNFGGISETSVVASKTPKPTDFFVWVGEDRTVLDVGEEGIILRSGITYCWNGESWVTDSDNSHIMATLNIAMEWLKNKEVTDDSIPAVSMAKCLIATKVVAESLVAKYATLEKLTVEYASKEQLGESGTVEIEGGNIKAKSLNVDKIEINNAFMDALALRVLNLQKSGIIKSDNWNGNLSVVNKGDWVHSDDTMSNPGDYYLEDGTYKVCTNNNFPMTYIDTKRNVEPSKYQIDPAGKYVAVILQEVIQDNVLHIRTRISAPYQTPYTHDYYLYVGDSCIIYSDNYYNNIIWDGEDLLKTNSGATPTLLTKKALYDYSKISSRGSRGFIVDANGYAEFHNKVYATNLEIGGDSTFNGSGKFTGEVNATSGTFKGRVEAQEGVFNGEVNASSGTFNGAINARGINFTVGPGNILFRTIKASGSASAVDYYSYNEITVPFSGTFNLVINGSQGGVGGGSGTQESRYSVLRDGNEIWSRQTTESSFSETIQVSVSTMSKLRCRVKFIKTGGYKVPGTEITGGIYIDNDSSILNMLVTEKTGSE